MDRQKLLDFNVVFFVMSENETMNTFIRDFKYVILACQVLALIAAWGEAWYFMFLPTLLIGALWILQWAFIIFVVWVLVLIGRYAKRKEERRAESAP